MRSFKSIAKIIHHKRTTHAKRYSQSELSHLMGYKNGQFISNVERGLCNIPLKMMARVAEILDIPHADIKNAMMEDFEQTLTHYLKNLEKGQVGDSRSHSHQSNEATTGHNNDPFKKTA
jgi:transcriptional regulator with XRE-family HTH domain